MISVDDTLFLNKLLQKDFTFTCWIKYNSNYSTGTVLYLKGLFSLSNQQYIAVGAKDISDSYNKNFTIWNHFAITFSKDTVSEYLNGVFVKKYKITRNSSLPKCEIAKNLNAQIDDIFFFDKKLSLVEINQIQNSSNIKDLAINSPLNFDLNTLIRGRNSFSNCSTTKADSNTVDLLVKFKATSTSATLDLNLNNASLESRLGLTSAPNTCQAIQSNKNLRTDTFTGLTIGNEYTVRIEIGGDAALGYARTAIANNASITLVGGTVTGVENNSKLTFSIAPNPSNGNFTYISDENADIVISDLLGSKVADLQNVSPNQNIDLQLLKGIYLLNVSNSKGSKIEKLVIE
jgi:hypothetical protein